jgi:hypothetical protein
MPLEVDGRKERMAKLINLKDLLQAKDKTLKFVLENPPAVLYYKAQVVFQEEGLPEKVEKVERVERVERQERVERGGRVEKVEKVEEVKQLKRLKFEDEGTKEEVKR